MIDNDSVLSLTVRVGAALPRARPRPPGAGPGEGGREGPGLKRVDVAAGEAPGKLPVYLRHLAPAQRHGADHRPRGAGAEGVLQIELGAVSARRVVARGEDEVVVHCLERRAVGLLEVYHIYSFTLACLVFPFPTWIVFEAYAALEREPPTRLDEVVR